MLQPISPPPGVWRNGSEYQAAGRWWDASLVRWRGQELAPIGGWRIRSTSQVSGLARAMLAWRASESDRWIAIGTPSKLYVQSAAGANFDITPAGLTAGVTDEAANTGFGAGSFGAGAYGVARPDTGATTTPATVWDLDLWGNELVALSQADGKIYLWALDTGTAAAAVSGAPTGCAGIVVSEQGFLMALAPGGDPRKLQWTDQGDETAWTPSSTNQAGDVDLVTGGTLVKGVRLGPVVLILTDQDAHAASYVGLPSVFSFQRVGAGCGAISKGCLVAMGAQAAWWSSSGFWLFDGGAVQPIESEVWEYLKANLNTAQRSKVTGFHNSEFGEVWWFYPSAASSENDSYVYWDYRRNHWGIGLLARTCAAEPSVFRYPVAVSPDGDTYEHEVGVDWSGGAQFAETGPIELGNGDRVMRCGGIVSDEATAGQAEVTFTTRLYPNAAETTIGPTALSADGITDLRFSARQVKLKITGTAAADWRFGRARLDLTAGGYR